MKLNQKVFACRFLISFVLVAVFSAAYLFAEGTQTATANPHYANPKSGVIEDKGNNPAIGQGMCESVLHTHALFEEYEGKLYVTVRYNLAEHIKKVNFAIQNEKTQEFIPVKHEIVKKTEKAVDYRFFVGSSDALVRTTLFIEPMGRDVVFYFDFDSLVDGNTDFLSMQLAGPPSKELSNTLESDITNELINKDKLAEQNKKSTLMSSGDLGYDHGLLTKDSKEIREVFGRLRTENTIVPANLEETRTKNDLELGDWGFASKALFNSVLILVVIIALIFVLLALALYTATRYMINKNNIYEDIIARLKV